MPAQQVVRLVIALALYRQKSVKGIVDTLDLALPEITDRCITSNATTQARQRMGAEPLRWLFEHSAKQWISQDQDRFLFHGLNLLAMDGTTLRLADSAANREHFGAQNSPNEKVAGYAQARGVTLVMLETQIIRDARFGSYETSETTFAHELLASSSRGNGTGNMGSLDRLQLDSLRDSQGCRGSAVRAYRDQLF